MAKKQTPIQSRVVWMAIYPTGLPACQVYAFTKRQVIKDLTDDGEGWEKLRNAGWRVARMKVAPLRQSCRK